MCILTCLSNHKAMKYLEKKSLKESQAQTVNICHHLKVFSYYVSSHQVIGKPKNSLEEMAEENFLVDPAIVGKRKTSKVQVKISSHSCFTFCRFTMFHYLLKT